MPSGCDGNLSFPIRPWIVTSVRVADNPPRALPREGKHYGVFRSLSQKTARNQLLRRGGGDLGRDYQRRERLGNNDDNTDSPAHFLRILSMAFPLASSSTNLSR